MYLISKPFLIVLRVSHLACCSFWDISRLPYLQRVLWELFPREQLNTGLFWGKNCLLTVPSPRWVGLLAAAVAGWHTHGGCSGIVRQLLGQARYLLQPEHFIHVEVLKGECLGWPTGFCCWVQSSLSVPKDESKTICGDNLSDFWVLPVCITIGTALKRQVANKQRCSRTQSRAGSQHCCFPVRTGFTCSERDRRLGLLLK